MVYDGLYHSTVSQKKLDYFVIGIAYKSQENPYKVESITAAS